MEKYLPLGTVVLLKGATRKLMIVGYCPKTLEDNKTYDYSGVLYPYGLIKSDEVGLFNHDSIDKVIHLGIDDEEGKKIRESLK